MLILGIDSSTEMAAIGLIDDNILIGEINLSLYRRHSEQLLPNIAHLFEELDYSIKDLDGISVTVGPGSFTGLRIGLSIVKGFAQVLDIPVIGISTLEVLAYNYNQVKGFLIPMLDARRKRVYTALFDNNPGEDLFKDNRVWDDRAVSVEELLIDLEEKDNRDGKKYYLIGNGITTYKEEFKKSKLDLVFGPASFNKPRGGMIAELGAEYLKAGICDNPVELLPNYLKKPQAEINFKKIGSE